MSDDGTRIYVACVGTPATNGRIYVIDGNSLSIVGHIDVGKQSFGLVWHRVVP